MAMNSNATSTPLPDRIESTTSVTSYRELDPFCSSTAVGEKPFAAHEPKGPQTKLAARANALLAGSTVQDQRVR
jgi:hypothetical protein